MLYHVVLVTVKDGITDEQVDELLEGFAALASIVPRIRSFDVGRDAGLSPNPFGVVLVATFDGVDDFTAYRGHPAHVAFRRDLLEPLSADITSTQFDVS